MRTGARLVYFIDSLSSGGAQRQLVEIACHLHRAHRISLAVVVYHDIPFFEPKLREAGVPVRRLAKRRGFDPLLALRLRGALRELRPEIVHAFLTPSCLYAFLAVRSMPRAVRPALIAAERSALEGSSFSDRWVERLVYPRCEAVTSNAASVASDIEIRIGVPIDRIHYIPNGIDLAAWDAASREPSPIPLAEGRFHLGMVGGLRAEKNHLLLLEALGLLDAATRGRLQVWFVGAATGTPDVVRRIDDEIARRGFGTLVRRVPALPKIAPFLRRLDALVLPSRYEGFPNVLLEAMASAIPSIAARVGDVPNMLVEGRGGLVVPPNDSRALAGAIEALVSAPPEERVRIGREARARVEEAFTIERVAARHLDLYERFWRRRA